MRAPPGGMPSFRGGGRASKGFNSLDPPEGGYTNEIWSTGGTARVPAGAGGRGDGRSAKPHGRMPAAGGGRSDGGSAKSHHQMPGAGGDGVGSCLQCGAVARTTAEKG
eukprot:CAMPEP_0171122006 /NCGR_PEP_ID=MMETSP0766_2-20121228/104054_1 /TAXON_ID=439317 /ORGANISM="Gambierdiscus australes, Strain CAWD 149" /LENGTH=107 /DNA_ID=CAMNT_0011584817 /DNA_START=1 /DNA_END=321 /DNA_ORIENTATION=-